MAVRDGAGGMVRASFQPSSLKPKRWLPEWIRHLALCASGVQLCTLGAGRRAGQGGRPPTLVTRSFPAVPLETARNWLAACVALYRRGQEDILPMVPGTSLAWWEARDDQDNQVRAVAAARRAWQGREDNPGDVADPYFRQAFGDDGPIERPQFAAVATAVFEHVPEDGATAATAEEAGP